MIYNYMQLIGGLIITVGYIPQIVKIIRTRSCRDISLKSYIYLLIGVSFMEVYAMHMVSQGQAVMFFITNSITLIMTLSISILIIKINSQGGKRVRNHSVCCFSQKGSGKIMKQTDN